MLSIKPVPLRARRRAQQEGRARDGGESLGRGGERASRAVRGTHAGDNAHDGANEVGKQVPRLHGHSGGRRKEPDENTSENAPGQRLRVGGGGVRPALSRIEQRSRRESFRTLSAAPFQAGFGGAAASTTARSSLLASTRRDAARPEAAQPERATASERSALAQERSAEANSELRDGRAPARAWARWRGAWALATGAAKTLDAHRVAMSGYGAMR